MSADKKLYNNQGRFQAGDKFNQDPPVIEVEYDTGKNLSERNKQVADEARKQLED